MFCYCQLPLELSLSQQSIPVFFIHKFLLMESSIYRKRGKRIEQNIYWMVPSSEIAQACNFFIQFQITYQLNTGPIALYTKEINWTLILYLASPRYRISLNCFVEIINIVFIFISYHSTGRGKSKFCGIQTLLYWRTIRKTGKYVSIHLVLLCYFFLERKWEGILDKKSLHLLFVTWVVEWFVTVTPHGALWHQQRLCRCGIRYLNKETQSEQPPRWVPGRQLQPLTPLRKTR